MLLCSHSYDAPRCFKFCEVDAFMTYYAAPCVRAIALVCLCESAFNGLQDRSNLLACACCCFASPQLWAPRVPQIESNLLILIPIAFGATTITKICLKITIWILLLLFWLLRTSWIDIISVFTYMLLLSKISGTSLWIIYSTRDIRSGAWSSIRFKINLAQPWNSSAGILESRSD